LTRLTIERETKETRIRCEVRRGTGQAKVVFEGVLAGSEPAPFAKGEAEGVEHVPFAPLGGRVAFAKHMIGTLAKWSGFDIDLHVVAKDGLEHHAIEDAAIVLGRAFRQGIDTGAIQRTADVTLPMDDALVLVALDLVERPFYEGRLPDPLFEHVLRSMATEGGFTLHVVRLRGRDPHHIVEAAFKGLALCLDRATQPRGARLSTKGGVELRGA
jgi:imidazoleglycerol-phosphate dehydratase